MSYVEKSLVANEKLICKANLTNFIYFNELLYFIALVGYYFLDTKVFLIPNDYALKSLIPLAVIWVIVFLCEIIRDKSTELGITDSRIIGKKGFISIKTLDTHLDNVDNIQISYSFWGRIFKYGTLIIESRSDTYTYKAIANPWKLKDEINSQIINLKKRRLGDNNEPVKQENH